MSFFSNLFKSAEKNIKEQMLDGVNNFMVKYANMHNGEIEDVAYIFAHAIQMINGSNEKELTREMRANNVSAEFGALNILQNFAMVEIKPTSLAMLIRDSEASPFDLYKAINQEKLTKGYISKEQFDENEMLAIKMHMASPLGCDY